MTNDKKTYDVLSEKQSSCKGYVKEMSLEIQYLI